MSSQPDENGVTYENRPIWHSPAWVTAIVGLVSAFLTLPNEVGNYLRNAQEIGGLRQSQELELLEKTLAQTGSDRIFTLRYLAATVDDNDAKGWAQDEVDLLEAIINEKDPVEAEKLKRQAGIREVAQFRCPEGETLFAPGEYVLSDEYRTCLDSVIGQWRGATEVTLKAEGHTSSERIPPERRNEYANLMQLSEARARAVAGYVAAGLELSPEQFTAVGYGSTRPVASNATAEGRALNQRVEMTIAGVRPQDWQ